MVNGRDISTVHDHVDRSFDLLGDSYRRRVVYVLTERGPATVGELADAVVSAGLADERDSALASLVHVHLPKLDDANVVEYEGPNQAVSLDEAVTRLEPFLSVAARREADFEAGLSFESGGFDGAADAGLD